MTVTWTNSTCSVGRLTKISGLNSAGSTITIGIADQRTHPSGFTDGDGVFYEPRELGMDFVEDLGTFELQGRNGLLKRRGSLRIAIGDRSETFLSSLSDLNWRTATIEITWRDFLTGDTEPWIIGHLPKQAAPRRAGTFTLQWVDGYRQFEEPYAPEYWSPDDLRETTSGTSISIIATNEGWARQVVFGSSVWVKALSFAQGPPGGGSDPPIDDTAIAICPSWNKPSTLPTGTGVAYTYRKEATTPANPTAHSVNDIGIQSASPNAPDASYVQSGGRSVPAPYSCLQTSGGTTLNSVIFYPSKQIDSVVWMQVSWGKTDAQDQISWELFDTGSDDNDGFLQLGTGARDATSWAALGTHTGVANYTIAFFSGPPERVADPEKLPLFADAHAERMRLIGWDQWWKNDTGSTVFYWGDRTWSDGDQYVIAPYEIEPDSAEVVDGSAIGEYTNSMQVTGGPYYLTPAEENLPAEIDRHSSTFSDSTEITNTGATERKKYSFQNARSTTQAKFDTVMQDRFDELSRANPWVRFKTWHNGMRSELALKQIVQLSPDRFDSSLTSTAEVRKRSGSCGRDGMYNIEIMARTTQGVYNAG